MKLDIYEEQYRTSKVPHYEAGRIGFGYDIEKVGKLGTALVEATQKKLLNDDEINSARVEADTVLAADKMLREYQEKADPDKFEDDIETERLGIQELINKNSKNFKLPASQLKFKEKMTRSLEENYMGQTLKYGYELQEAKYKDEASRAADRWKALLLSGSSLISVPDVMQNVSEYYETLGKRYHIPANIVQAQIKAQNSSIVSAYAYGMVDKNPQALKDLLVGQDFAKFKDYKASLGQDFTMEEFWENSELRDEYAKSSFGAKWLNIDEYVDYKTRAQLVQLADNSLDRIEKEKLKNTLLANSKSAYELDVQDKANYLQMDEHGSYPSGTMTNVTIDNSIDSRLGTVGNQVSLGEAKIGKLAKGHSISKNAKVLANSLDGNLRSRGCRVMITSNLRPEQKGSAHATGSAIDVVGLNKEGKYDEQATIEIYKDFVNKYGNTTRKKSCLFEMQPSRVKYIKQQLEKEGVDTSFVNWEQSEKYGATAEGPHLHLGIDPNADYSKTNSGKGQTLSFIKPAADRYKQLAAEGKPVEDCIEGARKVQLQYYMHMAKYQLKNEMVTTKNPDGTLLSPSNFGKWLDNKTKAILANKSLSDENRLIQLSAIQALKEDIPTMQKAYVEDPVQYTKDAFPNQATSSENSMAIQRYYGKTGDSLVSMTQAEAKVKATELEQQPIDKAIASISELSQNDLAQIQKQVPADSKLGVIVYASYGTPELKGDIVQLDKEWTEVLKAKATRKDVFPTNWESTLVNAINSNPIIKGYFADIDKTNPQEKNRMLSAMINIGAYKKYTGGVKATDKAIADYLAKNLIANNFATQTLTSARLGRTQINISRRDFNDAQMSKITRVCNTFNKLGINPKGIYSITPIYENGVLKEVKNQDAIKIKHNTNYVAKNAKLTSDASGMHLRYTYANPNNLTAGQCVKDKNGNIINVSFKDLVKIYDEASSLAGHWKRADNEYRIPGGNLYNVDVSMAMDAALEHILVNRYNWLGSSKYTQFKRYEPYTKNGMTYYNEVIYDKYGKVVSKKSSKNSPTGYATELYGFDYQGNIDLFNRPQVENLDGSISTVRSMTYEANINGKKSFILIPTVSDEGEILSPKQAIKYWKDKKQNLGIYKSQKAADEAAQQIHEQQALFYLDGE